MRAKISLSSAMAVLVNSFGTQLPLLATETLELKMTAPLENKTSKNCADMPLEDCCLQSFIDLSLQ